MTLDETMAELQKLGNEQTKKTWMRHGAGNDVFGCKIGDLKVVQKKIKGDQKLALDLYRTGNADAQYLAGLVADGKKMTKKEIQSWAKKANWKMVSEYTVPWIAAESPFGRELAMEWIDSKNEDLAAAGWNTYCGVIALLPDEKLDLKEVEGLLERAAKGIHKAPNRVRYCINSFVIAVGTYVKPLLAKAKATAKKIGTVEVDMGDTACKVPAALEYIQKIEKMNRVGLKRKTMKC